MVYERMARLAVNKNLEAVVIYRTNIVWVSALDGRMVQLAHPVRLVPGLYRCKINYGGNVGRIRVKNLRPVSVNKELADLDRRGSGTTHARTTSPGIVGFQECANASGSAARARRWESRQIAKAIRDHLGPRSDPESRGGKRRHAPAKRKVKASYRVFAIIDGQKWDQPDSMGNRPARDAKIYSSRVAAQNAAKRIQDLNNSYGGSFQGVTYEVHGVAKLHAEVRGLLRK